MNISRFLPLICLAIAPATMHGRLIDISSEGEYASVLSQNKPTLVEFSASWCSVCNRVKKDFESLAQDSEFSGINFVRVDIDQAKNLREKNGIVGVPSFLFIQGSTHLKESVGVKNLQTFKEDLRNDLRTVFEFPSPDEDEDGSGSNDKA